MHCGGVLPFLLLIGVVLGSLYLGIATPTEAGGIGAIIAIFLCIWRGKFSWDMLIETSLETVKVTSFLLLIVVGASILSWVFDALRLPVSLVAEVQAADFCAPGSSWRLSLESTSCLACLSTQSP